MTINSDDPPMFNTTLTNEYLIGHRAFGWGAVQIRQLVLDAVKATLLPEQEREAMLFTFSAEFDRLMES